MRSNPSTCENALRLAQYVLKQASPDLDEKLVIKEFIGHGTFSNVFKASLTVADNVTVDVAVKHLLNFNAPHRLKTELKYLQMFKGQASIATALHACFWKGHMLIVLPYIDCEDFEDFIRDPPATSHIRDYLRSLLQSLAVMHKLGIIHRDLKPANFLVSKVIPGSTKRRFLLIDFGLTEQSVPVAVPDKFPNLSRRNERSCQSKLSSISPKGHHRRSFITSNTNKKIEISPVESKRNAKKVTSRRSKSLRDLCECMGESKTCNLCHGNLSVRPIWKAHRRAGTAGFRPPEVLMRTNIQTSAIDIWCCGVILLSLITGKFPFFHGKGNDDMSLAEIATIFGMKSLQDCSNILGRNFISNCGAVRMKLKSLCNALRNFSSNVESAVPGKVCEMKQCYRVNKYDSINPPLQSTSFLNDSSTSEGGAVHVEDIPCANSDSGFADNSSTGLSSCAEADNVCFVVEECVSSETDHESTRLSSSSHANELPYPDSLYHLLIELLDVNPYTRISAEDALKHPFIQNVKVTKDFLQNYQQKKKQKYREILKK